VAARQPQTLEEAIRTYADPEVCRELVIGLRWPGGKVTCPVCGSDRARYLARAGVWKCAGGHARAKFSLKSGTPLQNSALGLDKWLPLAWMLANSTARVRSVEVHRRLGVTQKTAWLMLHRGSHAIEAHEPSRGLDLSDIYRESKKRDPGEWPAWAGAGVARGEMVEGAPAFERFCRVLQAVLRVPYAEMRRRRQRKRRKREPS